MFRFLLLSFLIASIALGSASVSAAPGWTNFAADTQLHGTLEFLEKEFGASVKFERFLRQMAIPGGFDAPDSVQPAWRLVGKNPEFRGLTVEGFDRIPGFSDAALRSALASQYPDSFLRASDIRIRYIAHTWPDRAADIRDIGYIQITVFNDPGQCQCAMTPDRALWLIQHEMGHASDWNYSRVLTPAERLRMLLEVTTRFNHPDHFHGYHEVRQIVYDPDNLQNDKYQAVGEYWADLAREYVRNPDRLRNDYPGDYEVARKWFPRLTR